MRILAIVQGEYGKRHVENIRRNGPQTWTLATWSPPPVLPAIIDEPAEYLVPAPPEADLLLAFQENGRAAQLIADVARASGVKAVVAPIDRDEWLPQGLAEQLSRWFVGRGIEAVFPRPFCSLTEGSSGLREHLRPYRSELIGEFARHFGRPSLRISSVEEGAIRSVEVLRDACCGCARFVAKELASVSVRQAEEAAGLAHHHFPCMASMGIDPAFGDTLMHVSGNLMKAAVREALAPWLEASYVTPDGRREGP